MSLLVFKVPCSITSNTLCTLLLQLATPFRSRFHSTGAGAGLGAVASQSIRGVRPGSRGVEAGVLGMARGVRLSGGVARGSTEGLTTVGAVRSRFLGSSRRRLVFGCLTRPFHLCRASSSSKSVGVVGPSAFLRRRRSSARNPRVSRCRSD